jgi:hypothetical protein
MSGAEPRVFWIQELVSAAVPSMRNVIDRAACDNARKMRRVVRREYYAISYVTNRGYIDPESWAASVPTKRS